MNKTGLNTEILASKNQLRLFGYDNYFKSFVSLYKKNKLPNVILLSGPSGVGKSTFAYHFINFVLSEKEKNKYNIDNFTINSDNKSYIRLCNDTHPNFALLENKSFDESIKIDNVRNVLKFLSKSTYDSNIKIVLIDNAEFLNMHSSNAILKVLEEADARTFFFVIHNNYHKILKTIKSRCLEFKFFFTLSEKKQIFENIAKFHNYDFKVTEDIFRFETPGNILKYLCIFDNNNIDLFYNKLTSIKLLMEKYKHKSNPEFLNLISLLIEFFYSELSIKNNKKLINYFSNKYKILKQIYDAKKFNLDKKNLFINISGVLENES